MQSNLWSSRSSYDLLEFHLPPCLPRLQHQPR
ncbi:hypothetical protein V12B01_13540 [Vibrio splendidus 12B01]|nr:hypothetical protein V12B01_13540 [Vibrio splendidus 12B01]